MFVSVELVFLVDLRAAEVCAIVIYISFLISYIENRYGYQ